MISAYETPKVSKYVSWEGTERAAAQVSEEKMTMQDDTYTVESAEDGRVQRDEQFLARLA